MICQLSPLKTQNASAPLLSVLLPLVTSIILWLYSTLSLAQLLNNSASLTLKLEMYSLLTALFSRPMKTSNSLCLIPISLISHSVVQLSILNRPHPSAILYTAKSKEPLWPGEQLHIAVPLVVAISLLC